MKAGINDTSAVAEQFGARLKKARENKELSRQAFCDEINEREDRPIRRDEREKLSVERLKKWEYGENPVALEWLPMICATLEVDVGYLFGEYDEFTRVRSDIVSVTGLSSHAVKIILSLRNTPYFAMLNKLLSSGHLIEILRELEETRKFSTTKIKELFDGTYKNDALFELKCMAGYLSRRNADLFVKYFEDICNVSSLNRVIAEKEAQSEH